MSDEKKAVTDDSDCDVDVGDEDEDDTQLMHKHKTAGKFTPYPLTTEFTVIIDIRSFNIMR